DCLRLEVTESAVIGDLDAATRALHGLSRLGVQLAVDDFGTGYSSLAYLRRFPVTTLKIDREFSNGLDGDASAETVLQAVASLGHGLGMQVTLEGVETLRQVEIARQVRCDRAQGNYFWAPLPGEAIAPILGAGAERAVAPGRRRDAGIPAPSQCRSGSAGVGSGLCPIDAFP